MQIYLYSIFYNYKHKQYSSYKQIKNVSNTVQTTSKSDQIMHK